MTIDVSKSTEFKDYSLMYDRVRGDDKADTFNQDLFGSDRARVTKAQEVRTILGDTGSVKDITELANDDSYYTEDYVKQSTASHSVKFNMVRATQRLNEDQLRELADGGGIDAAARKFYEELAFLAKKAIDAKINVLAADFVVTPSLANLAAGAAKNYPISGYTDKTDGVAAYGLLTPKHNSTSLRIESQDEVSHDYHPFLFAPAVPADIDFDASGAITNGSGATAFNQAKVAFAIDTLRSMQLSNDITDRAIRAFGNVPATQIGVSEKTINADYAGSGNMLGMYMRQALSGAVSFNDMKYFWLNNTTIGNVSMPKNLAELGETSVNTSTAYKVVYLYFRGAVRCVLPNDNTEIQRGVDEYAPTNSYTESITMRAGLGWKNTKAVVPVLVKA